MAGKALAGESPETTVLREIQEECGCASRIIDYLRDATQYFRDSTRWYKMLARFFRAEFAGQPGESGEHRLVWLRRYVRLQKKDFFSPPPRIGGHMIRVTGIGGIFFKAKDAPSLRAWYKRHLGIDVQVWGGATFTWTDAEGKPVAGTTVWSIGPEEGDQFAPSSAPFMVNYRVEDLHALVKVLKEEGCNVLEKIEESEYGKFAWVVDPEGNKVELWQPPQGQ